MPYDNKYIRISFSCLYLVSLFCVWVSFCFSSEVLKHTPRNHQDLFRFSSALASIEAVALKINESKRNAERVVCFVVSVGEGVGDYAPVGMRFLLLLFLCITVDQDVCRGLHVLRFIHHQGTLLSIQQRIKGACPPLVTSDRSLLCTCTIQ
jgi:hypothetical protein